MEKSYLVCGAAYYDMEGWLNCVGCRSRYRAFLSTCPRCGRSNAYHADSYPILKDKASVNKTRPAVIGGSIAAITCIAIIFVVLPATGFSNQFIPRSGSELEGAQDVTNQDNTSNMDSSGVGVAMDENNDDDQIADEIEEIPLPPTALVTLPPTSSDIDLDELALRVHELVNIQRQENGLHTLAWDGQLAALASRHSEDMAARNYFEHVNPDGKDPSARAEQTGYECTKDYGNYYTVGIAENLALNWMYDSIGYVGPIASYDWSTLDEIAESTVDGWMGSKGHRENILSERYDRQGIGIAMGSENKVLVTENFC